MFSTTASSCITANIWHYARCMYLILKSKEEDGDQCSGQVIKQINNGSQIFVDVKDDILDGYIIACKELQEKKLPFVIQRPLPNGACEYWKLADLELHD